eukprot:6454330-Amphidinium_carterae.1
MAMHFTRGAFDVTQWSTSGVVFCHPVDCTAPQSTLGVAFWPTHCALTSCIDLAVTFSDSHKAANPNERNISGKKWTLQAIELIEKAGKRQSMDFNTTFHQPLHVVLEEELLSRSKLLRHWATGSVPTQCVTSFTNAKNRRDHARTNAEEDQR